jgi:hypothetical protein
VNNETVTSNRGAVLLGELKALVDSFPQHRRKEVIKIFETVFTRLVPTVKTGAQPTRGREESATLARSCRPP